MDENQIKQDRAFLNWFYRIFEESTNYLDFCKKLKEETKNGN